MRLLFAEHAIAFPQACKLLHYYIPNKECDEIVAELSAPASAGILGELSSGITLLFSDPRLAEYIHSPHSDPAYGAVVVLFSSAWIEARSMSLVTDLWDLIAFAAFAVSAARLTAPDCRRNTLVFLERLAEAKAPDSLYEFLLHISLAYVYVCNANSCMTTARRIDESDLTHGATHAMAESVPGGVWSINPVQELLSRITEYSNSVARFAKR